MAALSGMLASAGKAHGAEGCGFRAAGGGCPAAALRGGTVRQNLLLVGGIAVLVKVLTPAAVQLGLLLRLEIINIRLVRLLCFGIGDQIGPYGVEIAQVQLRVDTLQTSYGVGDQIFVTHVANHVGSQFMAVLVKSLVHALECIKNIFFTIIYYRSN